MLLNPCQKLKIVSLDRDSFANVVDLLDDMFERCASADEPAEMNFVKKHAVELTENGVKERTAARLFSNPYVDSFTLKNIAGLD